MNTARRFATVTAVALLMLALSAGTAFALPPMGTIWGVVQETGTGTPVSGAVIEVWDDLGGTMAWSGYAVTADFSGSYTIGGLPAANYELHAADPTGRHFGDVAAVAFSGPPTRVDINMDAAGWLAGQVRDSGMNDLAGARVYLFNDGFFPLPAIPDPGTRTSDGFGVYSFAQVVDPLNAAVPLQGDYIAAAFEPNHKGQFWWESSDLAGATPITMGIGDGRTANFALGGRTVTPLGAASRLNDTGSAIPSDKMYVRRGGDALEAWYDSSLGGVVAKAGATESLVATFAAPYDGVFDVNDTAVFFGEGLAWTPGSGLVDLGYGDIANAQVACDNTSVAFLYEVPDPANTFLKRSWRIRVIDLSSGISQSHTFQRDMLDSLKLSPGGIDSGVVAFTLDDGTNGHVYTFDFAAPSSLTEVYSSPDNGLYLGAESAIAWGGGTRVLVLDQGANTIVDVEIATLTPTVAADFTWNWNIVLSGLRGDGTQGSYVFTGTDFLLYPLYDATLYYGEAMVPDSYTPIKAVTVVGTGALDEPTFIDYDYAETGSQMASMVGVRPGDDYHVYSLLFGDIDWLRDDLDRFAPADQRAPDVGAGGVAWLDWRTEASAVSGMPDVYYRKPGGTEKVIATRAWDLSEEIGLPQASSRWVAYAKAGAAPNAISFDAYDLSNDTTRAIKTDEPLAFDGSYYGPQTGLTGDWFVWVGGADRTVSAELRIRNILTGEERMLAAVPPVAPPYQVYFKASAGKVLYDDGAGQTHLYDIATLSDTTLPAPLPLDASFYSFEFDYPRAAYLDPMDERDPTTNAEQVGTLKAYDFRTDSETTLEEFFVIETGRNGGKPFALWKQALVAGSHIYDLYAGTEYAFPTDKAPAFVSIDATLVAAEISPAVASPSGLPEGDVYTVDVSSWVDATGPVTGVTGVPSGLSTTPVVLTFTATDTASGVDYIQIRQDPPGAVTNAPSPVSLTPVEGTRTITYSSVDNWGNWDIEHTATIVYDAPPVTTLDILSGTAGLNGWYLSPVNFRLLPTDTGSGLSATWISIDSTTPVLYDGRNYSLTDDGIHTVEYWSVDNHGTVEDHQIDTFKIDRTRPTVTPSLPSFSIFEGSQTLTITVTDLTSGPMGVDVQKDTDAFSSLYMPAPYVYTMTTPGLHGFYYAGRDLAGNIEPLSPATYQVWAQGYVDSIPLTDFWFDKAPVAGWYPMDGIGYLDASDGAGAGSGVANTYYTLDGSASTTHTSSGFPISGDGTHTVTFWSVDNVGHVETPGTALVPIDHSGPTITSDLKPGYEGSATITFSVVDPYSGVHEVQLFDGSAWGPWSAPWVMVDTTLGSRTVDVQALDEVGNVGSYSETYFIGAFGAPTTAATWTPAPNASGWNTANVLVSLSATDSVGGQLGSGVKDTFYRIGATTTTYTAPFAVNSEGTTSIEYWSVDYMGNEELPHNTATVKIDKTIPTVLSDLKRYYEGRADWSVSASDAMSGPRTLRLYLSMDGLGVIFPWFETGGTTANPSVAGEGDYDFGYDAIDNAGLHAYLPGFEPIVHFTIGTVSTPESSASVSPAPNANGWNRLTPAPTVTITATDTAGGLPGSGVANTYYKIGSTTTTYTAPFQVSVQGTTTVEYWSVDNVGTEETPHKTTVVKYDNVDPTVTHDGVAYYEGAGTITVTGHDSTSGPWRTEYMLAPAGGFTSGPDGAPVSFGVGGIGSHSFEYLCTDYAGNMSTYGTHPSFSYYVGAESTPTTLIQVVPVANGDGWNDTGVTISLIATDTAAGQPGSGVKNSYYRIGASAATTYTGSFSYNVEGTHTFWFWSVDNVGRVEPAHSMNVSIDRTRPTASLGTVSPFYEGTADLSATFVDSVSGLSGTGTYKLDSGGWTAWPGNPLSVSTLGSHSISVNAADLAGNVAYDLGTEPSQSFYLGAVSTPLTTIGGLTGVWSNHDVPITLSAVDTAGGQAGSGIANVRWRYGTTGGFTVVTGASTAFTVSAQGVNTLNYYATDNVGTAEGVKTAQVLIDKTGPTFSDDRLASYSGVLDSTLTVTAADPDSGITSFEYSVDGAATQTVTPGTPQWTLPVGIRIIGAGSHTVRYAATNRAGTTGSGTIALSFGKVSSTITLRTSAYSSVRRRPFILTGVLTPASVGTLMVVEVKKPNSGRWSYSSARLCYSLAGGGGANWWYRYTPLLRGTYTFRSRYDGNATTLGCYSPNTIGVRIR